MSGYPYRGTTGSILHVTHRAVVDQLLFKDFGEHLLFLRLLARALRLVPIDLFAFALMPNHFHLLVRLTADRQLSVFMHRLGMTHALALRRARGNVGRGAVYQGHYRASEIANERYFYNAARYVVRNPVRGGLTEKVEDYPWSSESAFAAIQGITLAPWPVPKPPDWREFVNQVEPAAELDVFRGNTRQNLPIGDAPEPKAAPVVVSVRRRPEREED